MDSKWKLAGLLGLYALMLWVFINLVDFSELQKNLSNADLLVFCAFVVVHGLTLVPIGLEFKALMEYYKIRLNFVEWFGLSVLSNLGNYIAPMRAGFLLKAVYLKKKFGFSYASFTTTFFAAHLASFLVFGLFGLAVLGLTIGFEQSSFGLFFGLVTIGGLVAWWFPKIELPFSFPAIIQKIWDKLMTAQKEWHEMRRDKSTIFRLALINLATVILTSARIYAGFLIFGVDIGAVNATVLSVIYVLTSLIPITPSGLGFREAGIVIAARAVGIDDQIALVVSLLDRIVVICIVFVLGAAFSFLLSKEDKKISPNTGQ